MKLSASEKTFKIVCGIIACCIAIASTYPLIYCFAVSICSETEWVERGGVLPFFPTHPTFSAYGKVLMSSESLGRAFLMSILRTFSGTIITCFFTSMVGYVLSKKELPGRSAYMKLLVFTLLFSGGLIPYYINMKNLGLLNTFWVYIIPGLVGSFNVLIFKQFFEGLPGEIIEAAEMDGVGEIRMLFRIVLPMSKPVFAAIGLFVMVNNWNAWFDAYIYIDQTHSELYTLQYFTMTTLRNLAQINADANSSGDSILVGGVSVMATTVKMALTIVTLLPILIIYPFFQKYFTQGVFLGAVKG